MKQGNIEGQKATLHGHSSQDVSKSNVNIPLLEPLDSPSTGFRAE